MEEKNKDQKEQKEQSPKTVISELIDLITLIVDYYSFKEGKILDEGEEWKKSAKIEKECVIPENIDKLIEKTFTTQLKKFS